MHKSSASSKIPPPSKHLSKTTPPTKTDVAHTTKPFGIVNANTLHVVGARPIALHKAARCISKTSSLLVNKALSLPLKKTTQLANDTQLHDAMPRAHPKKVEAASPSVLEKLHSGNKAFVLSADTMPCAAMDKVVVPVQHIAPLDADDGAEDQLALVAKAEKDCIAARRSVLVAKKKFHCLRWRHFMFVLEINHLEEDAGILVRQRRECRSVLSNCRNLESLKFQKHKLLLRADSLRCFRSATTSVFCRWWQSKPRPAASGRRREHRYTARVFCATGTRRSGGEDWSPRLLMLGIMQSHDARHETA